VTRGALTLAKDSGGTVVPQAALQVNSFVTAFLGNALNATSFSSHQAHNTSIVSGSIDIACDDARDLTYISYSIGSGSGDLYIQEHTNSSSWSTGWSQTLVDSTDNWEQTGLYLDGTDVYIFAADNASGTAAGIRLWVDTGGGFAEDGDSPLDSAASTVFNGPATHWSTYSNNETAKIGFTYFRGGTTDFKYNEYSFAPPPVVVGNRSMSGIEFGHVHDDAGISGLHNIEDGFIA
jgi:hypothetical protein